MLSRVTLLLFAARPTNVGVQAVLWVSKWLYVPFGWIDAGQPLYGARFERGSLLIAIILLVVASSISRINTKKITQPSQQQM